MGKMLELMEAFDFLCAVMNKTTIQSKETIEQTLWVSCEMVWDSSSGVFQQDGDFQNSLFGNTPCRRFTETSVHGAFRREPNRAGPSYEQRLQSSIRKYQKNGLTDKQ